MFVEKVKSEGLAHLSWVLGSDGEAAVIDPRRDCDIYTDIAANEGEEFRIGSILVRVLETPGHTDDSLSFAFYDPAFGDDAVGVFTGDALFIGDVGRTDFYPDRAREVAGLLYDSLQKLCALGDQAVLYPAHGAGSVCGNAMADREVSTIGYERRNNPRVQIADRNDFIEAKIAEHHRQPPYFRYMEAYNLEGVSAVPESLPPQALATKEFLAAAGWAAAGQAFGSLSVVDTDAVQERVKSAPGDWLLLDVRDDEVEEGRVTGARHAYAGELPEALKELDRGLRYTVMCGSGGRATIAASVMRREGFEHVDLYLGSVSAWTSEELGLDQAS